MQSAKGKIQPHIWQNRGRLLLMPTVLALTFLARPWPANAAGTADDSADIPVADANLFERLDADGNGTLTASEVATDQRRLFERLLRLGDENNDQVLDESEWQTAIEPRRPPKPIEEKRSANLPRADAVRLLLLKLDTNRDAMLTSKEVTKDLRPLFDQIVSRLDRNDDGRVNRLELARGGPQLARLAERAIRRFDIDVEQELKRLDRQQGSAAHRFDAKSTSPPSSKDSKPKGKGKPAKSSAVANKLVDRMIERLDRNKDGQISRGEAKGRLAERFPRADRNDDGVLDKGEIADIRAALAEKLDKKKRD